MHPIWAANYPVAASRDDNLEPACHHGTRSRCYCNNPTAGRHVSRQFSLPNPNCRVNSSPTTWLQVAYWYPHIVFLRGLPACCKQVSLASVVLQPNSPGPWPAHALIKRNGNSSRPGLLISHYLWEEQAEKGCASGLVFCSSLMAHLTTHRPSCSDHLYCLFSISMFKQTRRNKQRRFTITTCTFTRRTCICSQRPPPFVHAAQRPEAMSATRH